MPGSFPALCSLCGEYIHVRWRKGRCLTRFVLANLYTTDGTWTATAYLHPACYDADPPAPDLPRTHSLLEFRPPRRHGVAPDPYAEAEP